MLKQTCVSAIALILAGSAAWAQGHSIAEVTATLQTPILTEEDNDADADDPAIYIDATDSAASIVVTAVKNGGIRVYNLDGSLRQTIVPFPDGRINNVDLVYDVPMADGTMADLVIAADRGLDMIRFYKIDNTAAEPLTDVTDPAAARVFPMRQIPFETGDQDNPVDDQSTVYGLTAWHDKATRTLWIVVTQRHTGRIGFFKAVAGPDGLTAVLDHAFTAPDEHMGQNLWIENEDDPALDWSPQFEGVVVDRTTGTVYAGQEDVGIWSGAIAGGDLTLAYATRGTETSTFWNPDSVITRDVEGLTIYYAASGTRYLIASSQGGAHGDAPLADAPYDDSFAVFTIGDGLELLGSFRVAASDGLDAVQESDGADVTSVALPGFPAGLFITQDGYAADLNALDGEVASTNFKFVDWARIAQSFTPPLEVTPQGWDPRQ